MNEWNNKSNAFFISVAQTECCFFWFRWWVPIGIWNGNSGWDRPRNRTIRCLLLLANNVGAFWNGWFQTTGPRIGSSDSILVFLVTVRADILLSVRNSAVRWLYWHVLVFCGVMPRWGSRSQCEQSWFSFALVPMAKEIHRKLVQVSYGKRLLPLSLWIVNSFRSKYELLIGSWVGVVFWEFRLVVHENNLVHVASSFMRRLCC